MDTVRLNSAVDHAVQHIITLSHGTTILHPVMEELVGLSRSAGVRYYNLVGRVKHKLETEHGIFLNTHLKVGYVLCPRGEEIKNITRQYDGGVKQILKSVFRGSSIRVDLIGDATSRNNTVQELQKMANVAGLTLAGGRSLK